MQNCSQMHSADRLTLELENKQKRLQAYYEREQQILSIDGVKSYSL